MPGAHPAVARAEHLLQLGRPDAALGLLGPDLTQQPDDADLLTCAAYAYLLKEDWGQAAELGRRASAADPDRDRPLRIQASALLRLGQVTDATTLAHRAVQMAPDVYNSHLLYAQCLSGVPRSHEHAMAEARRGGASSWRPANPRPTSASPRSPTHPRRSSVRADSTSPNRPCSARWRSTPRTPSR